MYTKEDQQGLFRGINLWFAALIKVRDDKIVELEKRIVELEARGFKGIYQRACAYKKGQECTFQGATWVALVDVPPLTVPGKNDCWQMCEKSHGKSNVELRKPTASRTQTSNVA